MGGGVCRKFESFVGNLGISATAADGVVLLLLLLLVVVIVN